MIDKQPATMNQIQDVQERVWWRILAINFSVP